MENDVLQNESVRELPSAEDRLQTLIDLQRKTLRSGRIRTVLLALIGVLLICGSIYLGKKFSSVDSVLKLIETDLQKVDMAEINKTIEALEKAATALGKVDVASINSTVKALEDAADNLSKVDISALNELVKSLQTTASALENVINGWNNLFGR